MAENKHINRIIAVIMTVAVAVCFVLIGFSDSIVESFGGTGVDFSYESELFDTSEIISIDILMDEDSWNDMLENAMTEEYYDCDVVINGEKFRNVGIRPKGNTSLSAIVSDPNSDRFSLKLEFGHFVKGQTCFGLDKLILNNNYGDATNMKEAVIYDMFNYIGADASLYNYAQVSLNGEYRGVYLALEGVEKSFMLRNYGTRDGELYKPDSMEMGGGKSSSSSSGAPSAPDFGGFPGGESKNSDDSENGGSFGGWPQGGFGGIGGSRDSDSGDSVDRGLQSGSQGFGRPLGSGGRPGREGSSDGSESGNESGNRFGGFGGSDSGEMPDMGNFDFGSMPDTGGFSFGGSDSGEMPDMSNFNFGNMPDMGGNMGGAPGGFSMGGNGANLNYTDDELDSYSTIWEGEITGTGKKDHRRVVEALKNISEGTDVEKYLDVENVLKYMAVHTFAVNMDSLSGSMAHNYYLYEYEGQLNIIPWDYNLSLGGMSMGSSGDATEMVNDAIDTPFSGTKFFDALLENEEYLAIYHEYLRILAEEYVDGGRFDEVYNRITSQIDELVKTDPTAFYNYDEYTVAKEMLNEVIKLRAQSIEGQLDGSIASTDEGQRSDKSGMIDASHIDVKVMGQFSMGGFGGGIKERKKGWQNRQ
ncbi:MAG: CotH kinase family protein [Lachnospiraceae bacterium]|nr:CotH kinase family protein [Lachnospiraceae bacterium]